MSVARTDQPWVTGVAVPAGDRPDAFWRSLFFFNVYRLIVAVLLLAGTAIWGNTLQFGSRDIATFVITVGIYVLFSIASFALIKIRWRFNLQLTLQVAADIVVIVILIYASNGVSSGLGLLLFTTLAAAGLISRGRLALFHAALASIAVLLEHTYEVLKHDANFALYVQAGLLSGGYFATAWLAHTLARRALASEQLAARREIDLENMAQVNQLVIRDMQDGVLVVDGNGVIRQFNARAERILGPLRGQREVLLSDYAQALAARLERWRNDATGLDAASETTLNRNLSVRFVPVGKSRSVGAVIFLEDRTRVQAEARQMKLAALGRLTANIAHEIRNPLGAISHAAELLQEEPSISATTTRLLTIIHDNSGRLDRMVNDVLRLNRGDRVQRENFKAVDYLKTFIDQFCQIEKIPPEIFEIAQIADPEVLFDRNHFNQVMWNLCRNALRHCRRGKASIRIVVGTERGGSVVKLDVIDDGSGVPAAVRSQLFEPFVTTATGGTGLGLYIAREVCEANGATIEYVESSGGAQFTVLCRAG
ncbi:MAG: PAS domain-containing sensor histidine kinase [Pseudomonadota bacterium]